MINDQKIDIFIPVRLGNTRLPGKALRLCNDKPILFYLLERLKKSKKVRNIVVCTTKNSEDNELENALLDNGHIVFRGSEKDILDRFFEASKKFNPDFIINVDGDDIYTDPILIDNMVEEYEKTDADFIDMIDFPFGFRSVGFKRSALEYVCKNKMSTNTETGYRDFFYSISSFKHHKMFFDKKITCSSKIRLSLDYTEDLSLAEIIIKKLGNNFSLMEILELFKKEPELLKITEHLEERWKEHYNANLSQFQAKNE